MTSRSPTLGALARRWAIRRPYPPPRPSHPHPPLTEKASNQSPSSPSPHKRQKPMRKYCEIYHMRGRLRELVVVDEHRAQFAARAVLLCFLVHDSLLVTFPPFEWQLKVFIISPKRKFFSIFFDMLFCTTTTVKHKKHTQPSPPSTWYRFIPSLIFRREREKRRNKRR